MWKWLIPFVLLVILLIPTPVLADSSAEVTVTATGYIVEAPGGFTLTYISDYEVGISWTKGLGAENTMIRAAYGRLPESRTDGYLVYYGDLENTSDTAVSLDETATPIYYRAWSETAGGLWEETGIWDFIEGVGMTLIAFVLLVLGLTITAFVLRKPVLAMGAGGAWVLLAFWSFGYSSSSSPAEITDIYMGLFWIGIIFTIVCMFEAVLMRPRNESPKEDLYLSPTDSIVKDYEEMRKEMSAPRVGFKKRQSSVVTKPSQPIKPIHRFHTTGREPK